MGSDVAEAQIDDLSDAEIGVLLEVYEVLRLTPGNGRKLRPAGNMHVWTIRAAESCQVGHPGSDGRGAPVRGGRAGTGGAAEPPGGRAAAGALDETGHEKAGAATAGVKRQYMGCAGRVANGINTVHLSYVRRGNRARADRRPAVDPPRAGH